MQIREFLRGKSILITGATGFLGKPLVEKILYEVPDVEQIYLLIRPKTRSNGEVITAADRVRGEFSTSDVFDRLRKSRDNFDDFMSSKLTAIGGDVSIEGLDIVPEEYEHLCRQVDVIINSAAVVVFDERLDFAAQLNALGPSRLLDFAKKCEKNPVFIHVSTAYVNGQRLGDVKEILFTPGRSIEQEKRGDAAPEFDLEKEVEFALARGRQVEQEARQPEMFERFHKAALKELGPNYRPGSAKVKAQTEYERNKFVREKLVKAGMERSRRHGWHDTYTFTKAMGEQFLIRDRGHIRVAIVRPSIIESSYNEPSPGWIDGFRMADPLIAAYGKGRLKDFPGDPDGVLDIVPADFVVNALLASIPLAAESSEVQLFHVATGGQNPVKLKDVVRNIKEYFTANPFKKKTGEPILVKDWSYPSQAQFERSNRLKLQYPLTVATWFTRNVPGLKKHHKRISITKTAVDRLSYYADLYGPYVEYACRFGTDNTKELFEGLAEEEKDIFNFNVRRIDWDEYIQEIHVPGLKKHVLKMETVDEESPTDKHADTPRALEGASESLEGSIRTIQDLYIHSAVRFKSKTASQIKREDEWVKYSFEDVRAHTRQIRTSLAREGLKKGDRIMLLAENQPEWGMAYLGAISLGMIVVPLDRQTPGAEVMRVAAFVETKHIFITATSFEALKKQVGEEVGNLRPLNINNFALPLVAGRASGMPYKEEEIVPRVEVQPEDLASIIFTSGTTVEPKGVMLTHGNFIANVKGTAEVLAPYETDQFLSVLPLNHALEFTCGFLMPIFGGSTVSFVSALKSNVILETMRETGTTCMLGVPRLFKLFHDGIKKEIKKAGAITSGVVGALKTVSQASHAMTGVNSGKKLFAKVHEKFGGKIRVFVSGGAALDPEIFEDFQTMGFPICEGYGLTETAPVLTVNSLEKAKSAAVGPPLPNVELRLENQDATGIGEIVVRGPAVMKGYYKNEEATNSVLKDGWFHTGDLGKLDDDGYLFITGRVKDLIVTPAGKNVYPDEVEMLYRDLPGLKEMTVLGVKASKGLGEQVHMVVILQEDSDERRALLNQAVQKFSRDIPSYQRVQKVHFWTEDLPRTPTLKVKRNQVRQAIIEGDLHRAETATAAAAAPEEEVTLESEVRKLLAEVARIPASQIKTDHDIQYDLGLDSLEKIDFLVRSEKRWGIKLPESLATRLHRVSDAVAIVDEAVNNSETQSEPESAEAAAADWSSILQEGELHPKDLAAIRGRNGFNGPVRALLHGGLRTFCKAWLSVESEGAEKLPKSGSFVIAANHSSHLDTPSILASIPELRERIRILGARDYFFNTPLKSWFFRNYMNVLPFDRKENFLEGLRMARACLESDQVLLIFPEGSRSPNGEVQPFKVGLGIIAHELQVPIVPVRIQGTYQSLPKGSKFPRMYPVKVSFGEVVLPQSFDVLEERPNQFPLYQQIVDEVRDRIVALGEKPSEPTS
ncbi:MAG: AMP-binding protein [Planctomycetota bacterium]|nr:AMP-binding protein [Planctomycetota bacterium]MDA1140727.1 AMP-binding protein [Planctomycetota bacterium]